MTTEVDTKDQEVVTAAVLVAVAMITTVVVAEECEAVVAVAATEMITSPK